jgi:DNA-binding IclR family transcriptional regulator
MPFFSEPGDPTGTIAIAVPEDEMTADRRADLAAQLREAVRRIELGLTGL